VALGLILFAGRSPEPTSHAAPEAEPTSSEGKTPSSQTKPPEAAPLAKVPEPKLAESPTLKVEPSADANAAADAPKPEAPKAQKSASSGPSAKPKSTTTAAKKPETAAQSSKKASALDALGADITSQLK